MADGAVNMQLHNVVLLLANNFRTFINVSGMRLLFIIAFALFSKISFSQKKESTIYLEIVNYSDTVYNSPSSKIHLILFNNSDSPIIVSKIAEFDVSFIASYRKKGVKKSVKVLPLSLMRVDVRTSQDVLIKEILKPGNAKELFLSPQTWAFYEPGKVRIKAIYELSRLNPKLKNIESKWITQYNTYIE